jgi:sporulation protein YqfC
MHIWTNLKSFLYDNDDFIAYFNSKIYIYNFLNIETLNSSKIVIVFKNKKVIIGGKDLKPIKVLKSEILLTGKIESVNIYE